MEEEQRLFGKSGVNGLCECEAESSSGTVTCLGLLTHERVEWRKVTEKATVRRGEGKRKFVNTM